GGGAAGEPTPLDREIDLLLREREAVRASSRQPVTVPRHLSTSKVVQLAEDPLAFALALRRPMPSPPATAARRGTAFHAWVEQHFSQATMLDVFDLPGSADEDPGDDAELPRMQELFLASEWAQRTPEGIEVAIESTTDGIAVRGRIDAVFPRPGGGWTVVDWKTGTRPSAAALRVKAVQLAAYRLAYARLRGVPLEDVDAAFYYAATGETVWPELPGEDELVSLLRTIPQ
ncbi:RecB family exonuclease, partial [Oryzihumus sp.]|uniref:RecB family exonuclease n=1 Tax=Oryzihumus sp. TaxID=1968903 RepID=UPI002EDA8F38